MTTTVTSTSGGWISCVQSDPFWWQSHIGECGLFVVLIALALFILIAASQIPYWARTDRLWKTDILPTETPDKE